MTKSESAHITAQTMLLESGEQVLQLKGAGVRLAIPDTNNLIMVGTAAWIAANVPGAGEASERSSNQLHNAIMNLPCDVNKNLLSGAAADMSYKLGHRDARHAAAELSLAATTQASTAQAEPVLYQFRTRPDWDANRAWGEWENCTKGKFDDCNRVPHLHNWLYEARALRVAATSSTDAQAAAEVRDAALEEAAKLCEQTPSGDTHADAALELAAERIRALRSAGDTSPASDGCEHCIGTYCLLGEKCHHCGHEAESQGIKRSAGDTGGAQ